MSRYIDVFLQLAIDDRYIDSKVASIPLNKGICFGCFNFSPLYIDRTYVVWAAMTVGTAARACRHAHALHYDHGTVGTDAVLSVGQVTLLWGVGVGTGRVASRCRLLVFHAGRTRDACNGIPQCGSRLTVYATLLITKIGLYYSASMVYAIQLLIMCI